MPVNRSGELETISLVLTKDQARRLRGIAAAFTTKHHRVSVSDVGREVVEAGLRTISHTPFTTFQASPDHARQSEAVPA